MEKQENREKKYRTIKRMDRIKMEALLEAGLKPKKIAEQLNFNVSTIYRELKRGKTTKLDGQTWIEKEIYSSDLAQIKADENKKKKGRRIKIGNDYEFVSYLEDKILVEKCSPAVALSDIKKENRKFKTVICLTTLYNYIKWDVFDNITMADCPYNKTEKKHKRQKVQKRKNAGTSIEERPKEILDRKKFGHWEMDSVVGGQGKGTDAALVFTERKYRFEIVEKVKDHSATEVVRTLDKLERRFGEKNFRKIFKTITVDNGTEFSDCEGMERSRRNKKKRTKIYYCHAYSSYERGSNENNNKLIRRWYPKGGSFTNVTNADLKRVQNWMNNYPRKLFDYKSSADMIRGEPIAAFLL